VCVHGSCSACMYLSHTYTGSQADCGLTKMIFYVIIRFANYPIYCSLNAIVTGGGAGGGISVKSNLKLSSSNLHKLL
jgi:hypothetical protein